LQSKFTKSADKSKKKFYIKNSIWVSKNEEFHADFKSFEKMHHKKVISKNVMEKSPFSLFTNVRQTFFAYNFFWCICLQFFQRIRNQPEILRFLVSFLFFFKQKFFLSY
jgi:hypothetical protein